MIVASALTGAAVTETSLLGPLLLGVILLEVLLSEPAFSAVFLTVAGLIDPAPAHLVGTGGAVGAICRHWVYLRVGSETFPWPTLVVNTLGSALFGGLLFSGAGDTAVSLLGLGFCGAFTTFSTFSVETVHQYERGDRRLAVANAVANLACSLAGIGLAWLAVSVLG